MTSSLSANQALAIVNPCPFALLVTRPLNGQLPGANLAGRSENPEFILALPQTCPEAVLRRADKPTQPLWTPIGEQTDGQRLTANICVAVWRENGNASSLPIRTGMALSQTRADHSKRSLGL